MAEIGVRSRGSSGRIEDLIAERVFDRSAEWFPDLYEPTLRVASLNARPTCLLFAVRLDSRASTPQVLAKVRRELPVARSGAGAGRPRLHALPTDVGYHTSLEYGGLRSILNVFGPSHPVFGVIRPLDHMTGQSTLLMDYVAGRTLRDAFIAESRLVASPTGRRRRAPHTAWGNAGAWLRRFHDSVPGESLPAQQVTRCEVVDHFHQYGAYLSERLGPRKLGGVASKGAELAAGALPDRLPLAVGHGDYAPRNMFVDGNGRVTVFDPMPRWRQPRYEDLCRFTIGMRLLGLQLSSHGAAYSRGHLNRREREFLTGYFGDDIPWAALRCYQLLILLDKWSALVDAESGDGWRTRLRSATMLSAHEYIGREARRLLTIASNDGD